MWSEGTGSEVVRRIADPMVGGVVSTILTLLVIPPLYVRVKAVQLRRLIAGASSLEERSAVAEAADSM